jgi:hypothetical protein
MSNEAQPVKHNGHADYERKDIGVGGVIGFLIGLAAAVVICFFLVQGLYNVLEAHFAAKQPAVSPLATNVPKDTRKLPSEYKTDAESRDYEKYLQQNFPAPQLETNERTELNKIRLREENVLSTYDYVDKNAGTIRIPIDRAMDLLVQRGLAVRPQSGETPPQTAKSQPEKMKGSKQ